MRDSLTRLRVKCGEKGLSQTLSWLMLYSTDEEMNPGCKRLILKVKIVKVKVPEISPLITSLQ